MNTGHTVGPRRQTGSALLITLIFVALFASMAVALAIASDTNLAISRNRIEIAQARNLVEAGLLLAQREIGGLEVTGSDATEVHASLASHFQAAWANAEMINAAGITANASGVTFPSIRVLGPDGRTGTITLALASDGGVEDSPTITLTSTGQFGGATRTAYYDFNIRSGFRILSDYGLASKSPIVMTGNATIDGANNDAEGSLFSCSDSDGRAIEMKGQSQITGDAAISAPDAEIYVGPNATVGGEQIDNAPDHEWPDVDTAHFEQYVQSTYTGNGREEDGTYTNIRIPPNTNPTFNGNTNLYGVIYIESPNQVTFNGNANICGIVVCEEPAVENFDTNSLTFNGNLTASGVEYLPSDPSYDGLRDETGTFLLAPGYSAKFNGNFSTVNGYIAAGQLDFTGSASGTVRGGVLNLSDSSFTLGGGAHLTIDKQNADQHPAGFSRRYSLICVSGSYRE